MNKIPAHWKVEKLGAFVEKQKGKKPKNLSATKTEYCNLPYVDIKAFEKGEIEKYTDGKGCILCEDNDFLIVWDGSRSGLVGKAIRGALGSTLMRINFPCVDNNYAFYFLKSKYFEINTRAKGSGTPHVDPDLLWNYTILLPPLPEQRRIVAKIEELFSGLDHGIASLKKAKEQLKVYRQSVLKWAFEGGMLSSKTKWKKGTLNDVCIKVQDGSHFSPKITFKDYQIGRYLYITSKNIRNNYLDLSRVEYVDEDFHNSIYNRCNPEYGDVLLTKDGVNTGNVAINCIHDPISLLSSVCLLKPDQQIMTPQYLCYYLQSPQGYRNITGEMTGTAIKRIILKKIKEATILFPNLYFQEKIVQEIESRFSVADNLEKTIDQSLQQAEALRQSILKRAFEGKLVAQDLINEDVGFE